MQLGHNKRQQNPFLTKKIKNNFLIINGIKAVSQNNNFNSYHEKNTMKRLLLISFLLTLLTGSGFAQCGMNEIEVKVEITTDPYGNETYWTLFRNNHCAWYSHSRHRCKGIRNRGISFRQK